jgi:hypothetical protein
MLGCGALLGITDLNADGQPVAGGADATAGPTVDGGGVRIGAEGGWCAVNAPGAAFCDDFGGASLSEAWSIEAGGVGGTGTLDGDVHTSAPFGFTARVEPTATGFAQWSLRRTFAESRRIKVAFDGRLDTLESQNTKAEITLATVSFAGDGKDPSYALDLTSRSDGLHVVEHLSSGSTSDHPLSFAMPEGAWKRIGLSVDTGAPPSIAVTVDDGALPVGQVAPDPKAHGAPTVHIGIPHATGPSGPRVAHIDNLVVDLL